tara:strand:+ start:57402 stop:60083 length:2682 start_codon:yes stop_codon:yes gene_type:complete
VIRAIELVVGLLIPKRSENRRKKRLIRDNQPYQISIIYWAIFTPLVPVIAHANEPIPQTEFALLESYCLDCHDDIERRGELSLEELAIDWQQKERLDIWERALRMLKSGEMPPKKKRQPSTKERARLISWLDASLSKHSPIGGTVIRRLNRREYVNSINSLLDIEYILPDSFPTDSESHGFDNQSEALPLSGALMQSYSEVATDLAEKLFPPLRKPIEPSESYLTAADFTYAYSSGLLVDDVMRLVSSSEAISASASWPIKFEASTTGIYRFNLELSAFNPTEEASIICSVHAVDAVEAPGQRIDSIRLLDEFEISGSSSREYSMEALLEKGETIALRYGNSSLAEDRQKLPAHVKKLFIEEPLLAAAYKQADGVVERGRIGWERLKALMKSDLLPEPPEEESLDELVKLVTKNLRLSTEVLQYKHFEEGPALDVHKAIAFGPIELAEGADDLYWKDRSSQLTASLKGRTNQAAVEEFLQEFLPRVFRRPVKKSVIDEYAALVEAEGGSLGRIEDGLHFAFRTALTSPYFLYRDFESGPLDAFDLASRLSYFLASRPPDDELFELARSGALLDSLELRDQAIRLLSKNELNTFIESFLDQWLDLAVLDQLTPDKTLFPEPRKFKYGDEEKKSLITEPKLFFKEMLAMNRPLVDFIDPGFTYTNESIGTYVYELPMRKNRGWKDLQRVEFEKGGRYGGILGMAGVMTATANGVDTQPVARGVWMLENILGDPPRDPPDAVPALTPDTSKAETPREMLAAHMSDDSCAGCHKKIDPIGFVFESFDPIGRWRTQYPSLSGKSKDRSNDGFPVETEGVLPDGSILRDIRDLKAYLVNDIRPFAECLSEKLLTYATGRSMNFSDRKLIGKIVDANIDNEEGFKELLLDLIDSESFRTR